MVCNSGELAAMVDEAERVLVAQPIHTRKTNASTPGFSSRWALIVCLPTLCRSAAGAPSSRRFDSTPCPCGAILGSLWSNICWPSTALRGYDFLHAPEIFPRETAFRLMHQRALPGPARLDELSEQQRRPQPVGWRRRGWQHFKRSCLWRKRGGHGRRSCGRHRRPCCGWRSGRRSDGPIFSNRRGRGRWQRGGRRPKLYRFHA